MARKYFYKNTTDDIMWFENARPGTMGNWRTRCDPNKNTKSTHFTYRKMKNKTVWDGRWVVITKEQANDLCKKWYKEKNEQ